MTASGANEALLAAYTQHLATQPARTREAYLRDVGVLKALAGEAALTALPPAMLCRFLAALHARGLSGRSLARVLSGWRAFYRFALERDAALKDDPCAGLKAPKSVRRLPAALSPGTDGRASFAVSGCHGFVVGARGRPAVAHRRSTAA